LWSGGCASTGTIADAPPAPSASPTETAARIAILPFANETNTVDAPEILRTLLFEVAAGRRYALQPLEETDRRLREQLQISDGGQLAAAIPSELGDALEVETLFYGDVLEWKKVTTGIYNMVTVKARFKLVDAASGAVRWERTHEVRKHIDIGASGNIGADILTGALINLFLNPVTPYASQLAREIGQQLPDTVGGTP
jgi:hypothetical protein